VVLDVVYDHLGPAGNYLGEFGPNFSDRHTTAWGDAVNLDGPGSDEVRRFVIDNALHWFEHYHVDGLRLDAVHALVDDSALHILEELVGEVRRSPRTWVGRCSWSPRAIATTRGRSAVARPVATGWTPGGPTSGTTPGTPCSLASGPATTRTMAR
jgi:1,4-alpha-glucan branching enzyme